MPIYEYRCEACEHEFELLVRKDTRPACPACESESLERLLSLPRVHSETTRAQALKAAKKRDAALGRERVHEQRKYEQSHND
ncbi:MAG: zinc ribbon domain-containing protein [Gemmatimonadota bacterium]|nr:zinc ribbon domain-containing protein [Gemmatimonadota bacterium]